MLTTELLCLQLGNSFAASLSFLWTKRGGAVGFFDAAWYQQGGATTVLSMVRPQPLHPRCHRYRAPL